MQRFNLALEEVGRFGEDPHQLQDGIADLRALEVRTPNVLGRLEVFPAAVSRAEVADITGIWPDPSSTKVWLATYGADTGKAGVLSGNCQ